MKVAKYARVSTDKQAEKYGLPSQLEELRKRSQERSWTPVFDGEKDAFIDDGYSGAELDRPALNRLRQAAREGRVDVVICYDPDRLSRKLYHQMILAEEFEKQGIKLEFITQDMGTSPEDRMFFNMRGLVAEYEREKIRERTMRGSREKARQGKVVSAGAVPFFMMREDMEAIQKEQTELEKRKDELERQLAQRNMTEHQEAQLRNFVSKIGVGLDHLGFKGKQELLRTLIEKVLYNGQNIEIQTIIPPRGQLQPIHQGGLRG